MVEFFGISDIGLARLENEDRFFIDPERKIAAVADGMGGHNAGHVASRLAVSFISRYFSKALISDLISKKADVRQEMVQCLEDACRLIYEEAGNHPDLDGMGTTCVFGIIVSNRLHIAHVGDSRAYLFDGRALKRLTRDHTYVAALMESGQLTQQEAKTSPLKNRLIQALGRPQLIKPDYAAVFLRDQDVLLLCSDGLWDLVSDQDLKNVVESEHTPEQICRKLVQKAIRAGGRDNITAVVYRHGAHIGDNDD